MSFNARQRMLPWVVLTLLLTCFAGWMQRPAWAALKGQNIILVTLDGVRWQEIFGGADARLISSKAGGVRDVPATQARFWRDTPEARREVLMPFLWSTVARQGQIYGDPRQNCPARVVNGKWQSRAGYSEMLCGFVDEHADRPPVNVLEWLNTRAPFKGRVSLYACWRPMLEVLNADRGRFTAFAGWVPLQDPPLTEREVYFNRLIEDMPRAWPEALYDFIVMEMAMEHLRKRQPRVFHISLNDSDECGHDGRYDMYLQAIHNQDHFIERLWQTIQSMPQYAWKTTLIIAADHGRGDTESDWNDHGKNTPGSDRVWMAVLGPDTPALGVRKDQAVTLSQIAATLAAAVGEDACAAEPRRSPPLPEAIMSAQDPSR